MARVKPGDIVEIATEKGFGYAQCTHQTKTEGDILRVLEGLHEHPVVDAARLISGPVQFVTLFPLEGAVKIGLVRIVASAPVPPAWVAFPLFRMAGLPDPVTHKVSDWWLYDGAKEWRIGPLTADQRKLPIREVINDTLLKERLVAGWKHEHDA